MPAMSIVSAFILVAGALLFACFDYIHRRIAKLEAALEIASKGRFRDDANRIAKLEEALRSVRIILASDSIEYDDMRHMDQIIEAALAPKEPT